MGAALTSKDLHNVNLMVQSLLVFVTALAFNDTIRAFAEEHRYDFPKKWFYLGIFSVFLVVTIVYAHIMHGSLSGVSFSV